MLKNLYYVGRLKLLGKKSLNIVLFLIVLPCIALAQTGVISDATIIPPDYDTFQVPEEVGGDLCRPLHLAQLFRELPIVRVLIKTFLVVILVIVKYVILIQTALISSLQKMR